MERLSCPPRPSLPTKSSDGLPGPADRNGEEADSHRTPVRSGGDLRYSRGIPGLGVRALVDGCVSWPLRAGHSKSRTGTWSRSTSHGPDVVVKCPYCQADNDRVIDSRASEDGFAIRRRRECSDCRRRYTTYERVEGTTIKVIKKDGVREPFDRVKIKQGLEKACWKRPVSDAQIESLLTSVENELETRLEAEVETRVIGEMVMQRLRQVDEVAYVRFASVYRQFKDLRDFVDELKPMLAETRRSQ